MSLHGSRLIFTRSLTLSHTFFLALLLTLFVSHSLSLSPRTHSHTHSLSISLCQYLSLTLSDALSLCVCLSVIVCVSLSPRQRSLCVASFGVDRLIACLSAVNRPDIVSSDRLWSFVQIARRMEFHSTPTITLRLTNKILNLSVHTTAAELSRGFTNALHPLRTEVAVHKTRRQSK